MRLKRVIHLIFLVLLAFAGSAGAGMAQQPGQRDLRAYPPGYYPGKLIQRAPPQQGFSLRRLFGAPEEPPPARRATPRPRKPKPAAPPVQQAKPKVNPSFHVVVFGDSLAGFLRQGLDDVYAQDEDVAVVSKVRNDTSLVRDEPDSLPNLIRETLDGGQNVTVAAVMLGYGDRAPLLDEGEKTDLLSNSWKDLYRQRVDAVLGTFRERNIPVVWVGLPPTKNGKTSVVLAALNDIYRESAERHGAAYVDIWPGFVDGENRYAATGPDVTGEIVRLRTNDGVSFTKAGARKLAHFADAEIKRILDVERTGKNIATLPGAAEGEAGEGVWPSPPDAAPVSLPVKPQVGPVLPLTRPEVTPGGTLLTSTPSLSGEDHVHSVQRALRGGIPPRPQPGRADDFRWPRS